MGARLTVRAGFQRTSFRALSVAGPMADSAVPSQAVGQHYHVQLLVTSMLPFLNY